MPFGISIVNWKELEFNWNGNYPNSVDLKISH